MYFEESNCPTQVLLILTETNAEVYFYVVISLSLRQHCMRFFNSIETGRLNVETLNYGLLDLLDLTPMDYFPWG
jgi:hypothetical protein